MEKFNDYEKVQPFASFEKLPAGGYIIEILEAHEVENDNGKTLDISFDIAEGDYKCYYSSIYKNSQMEDKKYKGVYRLYIPKDDGSEKDGYTKQKFKTCITLIEESNPGYHWDWDEKKLAGKKVGAIFYEKEYDYNGKKGFFTTIHSLKNIEIIKEGKFKIPEPKLLPKTEENTKIDVSNVVTDDDLPF